MRITVRKSPAREWEKNFYDVLKYHKNYGKKILARAYFYMLIELLGKTERENPCREIEAKKPNLRAANRIRDSDKKPMKH